jgi:signal transduction histidine kinase
MLRGASSAEGERVLIHAPFGRDGTLIHSEVQAAGFPSTICASIDELCSYMAEGAGAALIADEALVPDTVRCLAEHLAKQPPWSDFPLLIMTSGGASTRASRYRLGLLEPLGNVTLLERPLRPVTLVSSLRAALRARRHQYELCEYLTRIEASERALRESEGRFRFLSELGEAARSVSGPDEVTAIVRQRLDEQLQVSRCSFDAVDGAPAQVNVLCGYAPSLQRGLTLVIRDVQRELPPGDTRECLLSGGVQAIIACPLLKDGRMIALMSVEQSAPRAWTGDEVELVEEVVERCGAYIERAENNRILQRTNQDLVRANRELEEFAYVASHDLQEPIRMVKIYTQLLLKELGDTDPSLNQYADVVRQGAVRMEELIRDLLSFSRAVHTEASAAGAADLSASLAEALAILKNRIEENGAIIESQPLPVVRGDTPQLAHVFQNLISNSIKYRKPAEPPKIKISAEQREGHWVVAVRDNGIGFEQQYAERIFGLFKRLHKEKYPGTGLGLAICQRIVERYGGRIWAVSKAGEGSTFHFSLPRNECAERAG